MLNTRYTCMLLNSGGYDSAVMLKYLYYFGFDIWSLTFDYGQHPKEIQYAVDNAKNVGVPEERIIVQKIPMDWCVNNALDASKVAGNVGYIPMRNAIFLSYALSLAETYKCNAIGIGILGCGSFADNNFDFIEDFRYVADHVNISIISPLDQLEKKDVYAVGNKLGVKIEDTWSCNTPREIPVPGTKAQVEILRCGLCTDCVALKEAVYNGLIETDTVISYAN